MALTSFSGRVLFSAIFILAAWQKITDYSHGEEAVVLRLEPKVELFRTHVKSTTGVSIPEFSLNYLLFAAIAAEGIGGILFVFGSTIGAYMLLIFLMIVTPVMHDFYNYELSNPAYVREFVQALKNLSLAGALLFYIGMVNSIRLRKKLIKHKSS